MSSEQSVPPLSNQRNFAILILCAGAGRRFGRKKQLIQLSGKPLLSWCLGSFSVVLPSSQYIIVHASEDQPRIQAQIVDWKRLTRQTLDTFLVVGGRERFDSIANGLSGIEASRSFVLIHDVARPLVHWEDIRNLALGAMESGAACLGYPLADSIRRVDKDALIEVVDRTGLWGVTTPQGFRTDWLRHAHECRDSDKVTDDAQLVSRFHTVKMVKQLHANPKLTYPENLEIAEALANY